MFPRKNVWNFSIIHKWAQCTMTEWRCSVKILIRVVFEMLTSSVVVSDRSSFCLSENLVHSHSIRFSALRLFAFGLASLKPGWSQVPRLKKLGTIKPCDSQVVRLSSLDSSLTNLDFLQPGEKCLESLTLRFWDSWDLRLSTFKPGQNDLGISVFGNLIVLKVYDCFLIHISFIPTDHQDAPRSWQQDGCL